jgi:hypothetical protein
MKEKGDKRLKDYFLVPPMFCQNKKDGAKEVQLILCVCRSIVDVL